MSKYSFYANRLEKLAVDFKDAKKMYRLWGIVRLFLFVLLLISGYFLWSTWYFWPVDIVLVFLFVLSVNKSLDAKIKRDKIRLLIELNEAEQNALSGDWSYFEDGAQFKDPSHAYSFDLDLFGKKSFYQYLNRTVLHSGQRMLANQLQFGTEKRTLTNQAITDLKSQIEWCQEFYVDAKVLIDEKNKENSIQVMKDLPEVNGKLVKALKWILPTISLSSIALTVAGILPSTVLVMVLLLVLVAAGQHLKKTNGQFLRILNISDQIGAHLQQLSSLQSVVLKGDEVLRFRQALNEENGNALDALKALKKVNKRIEFRMNFLVGVALNVLFGWDFWVLDQIRNWRQENTKHVDEWEDALAQIEVWISGAIYAFNQDQVCFAEFQEENVLEVENLGHPFIPVEKRVVNPVTMSNDKQFFIITGPNMAGKSTYLRSVGIAIISANAGFPILADSCKIGNFELYSSMRTSDDLTIESSYFHAELKRLRFIMDAIDEGKNTFIILDEILKGTNSKDKEQGSAKFLMNLKEKGSHGIIATHDLSLTKLGVDFNEIDNIYFDSVIEGNELYFDYLLRPGVCQNMNASFLLHKMKLIKD